MPNEGGKVFLDTAIGQCGGRYIPISPVRQIGHEDEGISTYLFLFQLRAVESHTETYAASQAHRFPIVQRAKLRGRGNVLNETASNPTVMVVRKYDSAKILLTHSITCSDQPNPVAG